MYDYLPARRRSRAFRIAIAAVWFAILASAAHAAVHKLTASDLGPYDHFGQSVGISGNTVVIGSPDGINPEQGSAYVYIRSGGIWMQQAKLTASDGAANNSFGFSVAISGNTIVVGAIGTAAFQGSAYVFIRSGGIWTQQAKLTAGDGAAYDDFGFSVAISANTLVVGAINDDVGANADQGSAYVFSRDGGVWTQQAKLTASDGGASDFFGFSVSISGNTVVAGAAPLTIGPRQGAAYVFVHNGSLWSEEAKLTASDSTENDFFGRSVAISGDSAVIGAGRANVGANPVQGAAYVFVRTAGIWTQQAKLVASDGAAYDWFGYSVAIRRNLVAIGAPYDNGVYYAQGSAYVFLRNSGVWTQVGKLTASDGVEGDLFGESVAISLAGAVVGAAYADVSPNVDRGSAYIFFTSLPALDDSE